MQTESNETRTVTWRANPGPLGGVNYVADGDGFWVSFNPDTGAMGIPCFNGDNGGCAETAICHNGNFYILNGDFRAELEPLIPKGVEACIAFYRENQQARSSWSTDQLAGLVDGPATRM